MSAEFPPTASEAARLPIEPPLSPLEARVLGCLLEKELATPDVYPLTLNALVNACNQRNNRAPLLSVGASEVEVALEHLRHKQLVTFFAGAEARVPKFKHRLDTVFPMDTPARAIFAELLLRGVQTSAALRANAERLTALPQMPEVEAILTEFAQRPSAPLVRKLPRQPGQKEARWTQLLTGEPVVSPGGEVAGAPNSTEPLTIALTMPPEVERRISALEAEVTALKGELTRLREALGGG